ncbi:hypothetical protein [Microbulbifer guangxiensis]|uniref:hypothetical protein n=1 Tax=Microbulbifer guangxiensis TaxID=2904249 RepID=UPI001F2D3D91|nr:hypothetical protein [Microbulbifer guangxiensis]
MKTVCAVLFCWVALLCGCTYAGAVLDEEVHEVLKRDQSASVNEPRKKTNDFAELGLLFDAAILKTILISDRPQEKPSADVPTYCYPPFKQVCSARDNICICKHDDASVVGVQQKDAPGDQPE